MTKIVIIEAENLENARAQVKSQIPEGFHLLSEQVLSDGKPKAMKATGKTTKVAFAEAQILIPTNATIINKEVLSVPDNQAVKVKAFDENSAKSEAKQKLTKNEILNGIKLTAKGKKGFFGIGKTPNQYEVDVLRGQAIVEITYKENAKISIKIGPVKEEIGISLLVISKDPVLKKDVSDFEHFVDSVSLEQLRSGQEDYATAVLSIDGFNDDPRAVWHIPEVREWFKALHSARPYAPYFLSPATIQIYVTCLEPFLPLLLPEEYRRNDRPPVAYLFSYVMGEFMSLLREVSPPTIDDCEHLISVANDRVLSAVDNLLHGKVEPI